MAEFGRIAEVELSSEDPEHPIEAAFGLVENGGWRAGEPGVQTIRLIFEPPRQIRRIWLTFIETTVERTQEYQLQWLPKGEEIFLEIMRQQWNFSAHGSTREVNDHHVNLPAVSVLELVINPDISKIGVHATLAELRLA